MDLQNLCRLCRYEASNDNELTKLFDNNLNEKLRICFSINLEFNENLPSKICEICRIGIEQTANFKKRCEQMALVKKQLANQVTDDLEVVLVSSPKITSKRASSHTSKTLPAPKRVKQQNQVFFDEGASALR